jgi:hypothetical protein
MNFFFGLLLVFSIYNFFNVDFRLTLAPFSSYSICSFFGCMMLTIRLSGLRRVERNKQFAGLLNRMYRMGTARGSAKVSRSWVLPSFAQTGNSATIISLHSLPRSGDWSRPDSTDGPD